ATFSYRVSGDLDNGYVVESAGSSGHAAKVVNATLRLKGLFDYGILAQYKLNLMKGNIVDGYNSGDPNDTDVELQIATASDVPWHLNIEGAIIDGEVYTDVEVDFPPIIPPVLPDMGAIKGQDATVTVIGPGQNGKYQYIELKTGAILEIAGEDVVMHVTGDIWLGQGCEILVKPGSSLTLYLDGNLIAGNSNGINNETQIPSNFVLFGTGEKQIFDLKAKSAWYGAVYAPNATTTVFAGGDMYGAFVCSDFEMKSACNLYYDEALRDEAITQVGSCWVVDRWFEGQANEYFSVDSTTGDGQKLPADPISP
ncbi:MAG: DUF7305 domain-containing protein, partial [Planctomycetota bacterium]